MSAAIPASDHHDGVPIHVLTHHPDDGVGPVELELTRRLEGRGVTHLRYVVRYP